MSDFAAPLQRLIEEFRRLPGIGQKSAQRIAFYVLRNSRDDAARLAQAMLDVKDNLGICSECNNISDGSELWFLLPRSAPRYAARPCAWLKSRTTSFPSKRRGRLRGFITCSTARFLLCAVSDRSS